MSTRALSQLHHSALWTATLLLWLGTGALGISEQNLYTIIDFIKPYDVKVQFPFAISLEKKYCNDPSNLSQVLPSDKGQDMKTAMNQTGALYKSDNFVAAAVNQQHGQQWQHAEWRLLKDKDSHVQRLLTQTEGWDSCLIFFTLRSPCMSRCLNKNEPHNIIKMVNNTFCHIDNNYKAFVFQDIYWQDKNETRENLRQAWHQLTEVPLLRCNNRRCQNCDSKDPKTNVCLAGMRPME